MAAIPVWLLGRHVTTLSVTPQTVAANGTLSDGVASNLVGSVDAISINNEPETEEISAMITTRQNFVIVKEATSLTLTEILKYNGTNLLAALAAGSTNYFKVICTRGGQTWTFYGLRGGYTEDLQRGKSTGTMTFLMVDPNETNPAYA